MDEVLIVVLLCCLHDKIDGNVTSGRIRNVLLSKAEYLYMFGYEYQFLEAFTYTETAGTTLEHRIREPGRSGGWNSLNFQHVYQIVRSSNWIVNRSLDDSVYCPWIYSYPDRQVLCTAPALLIAHISFRRATLLVTKESHDSGTCSIPAVRPVRSGYISIAIKA